MAVADGRSAIDRASTQHFDVVLLDIALGPGSPDGYEVCRELRDRRNSVAVIMLTALDSEADAVLGLEAGADDYVIKPFRPGRAAQPHPRRAAARRARATAAPTRRCASARSRSIPGLRDVQRDGRAGRPHLLGVRDPARADGPAPPRPLAPRAAARGLGRQRLPRPALRSTSTCATCARSSRACPRSPQLILTVRGAGYRIGEP